MLGFQRRNPFPYIVGNTPGRWHRLDREHTSQPLRGKALYVPVQAAFQCPGLVCAFLWRHSKEYHGPDQLEGALLWRGEEQLKLFPLFRGGQSLTLCHRGADSFRIRRSLLRVRSHTGLAKPEYPGTSGED